MIIQVYDDDMLNGEGLREVVFLQGCPHHCPGCFSPETWEFKEETKESVEQTNSYYKHLVDKIIKPHIAGITITGGEPLVDANLAMTLKLSGLTKWYKKTVWIYTGYEWEEILERSKTNHLLELVLKYADVMCVGKFNEELKSPHKPWVGSENQRVIDVKKSLKKGKVVEWE